MIRFFATHPTAANLLMVGIMVLGVAVLGDLKRETFPDIPADEVEIRAVYPAATASEVENAVCLRLEEALDGINDLIETRCEAREGVAVGVAKIREGADIDRFFTDVQTQVEGIDSFPSAVERPVITERNRTDRVASVAVSGPMSRPHLKAFAEEVKSRMLAFGGLSIVKLSGFSDHEIRIELKADALRQYGLGVADIAQAVQRQSLTRPAGLLETADGDIRVRFDDERRSLDAFRGLVVAATPTGGEIRLGDIARIVDRFENPEERYTFNGAPAALLTVEKTRDQDALNVMDRLTGFLEAERARVPAGVELVVTQDFSSIVRDRLNMLSRNGLQGLALVFFILWLFFGLRYSFWVTMGLPVSFMGALFAMNLVGYSIDMITMVGLLIAVGLLMDDAIVIAENVGTHRARGASPMQAAIDGTVEVVPGVVSSFITTACIFGSLAFITGRIGAILGVMPVILLLTLAVSLVEAFLVLPHHLAHSMGKDRAAGHHGGHQGREDRPGAGGPEMGPVRARFEAGFEHFRQAWFGPFVDRAIAWRYLTIGLVVLLLLGSMALVAGGIVKSRAFPDIDGDVVEARILMPQGTPLAQTEAVVGRVIAGLWRVDAAFRPQQPGAQPLVRNVSVQYGSNRDAYETGPHVATVSADLLGAQIRDASLEDVLGRWRLEVETMPDVISLKFGEPKFGPGGRPTDIRLMGDDLTRLKAASLELQTWLNGYRGMRDLSDDLRPGKPEVRLSLRDGASALGLEARDVADQVAAALQGREVDEIQIGREAYEIVVRLAGEDRDTPADLDYFHVALPGGALVPLNTVAEIESGRGPARIHRVNGRRTVSVQGYIDSRVANAKEILAETRARFLPELKQRYPGLTYSLEGQEKEGSKTGASIRRNMLIGLIGVFLLLSYQFHSYIEPLVVMSAIPLGVVGAIWGHFLLGLEMSMPSIVGLASLAGVVVNDTILLVQFLKVRRRAGMATDVAAGEAARARFRAILLTSLTTIAGLMPLLLERSLQAQILIPLATSLAFGLTLATGLSLILVPALYTILDDFGLTTPVDGA